MNALRSRLSPRMLSKSIVLSTALTTATSTSAIAFCEGNDEDMLSKFKSTVTSNIDMDKIGKALGDKVNDVIATGVPTEISYGFVCGFSSGFALKKIGKLASVVFGLGFVTLQSLSYAGYIELDHSTLQKDVESVMDLNKDGIVDAKDVEQVKDKIMEVLQFGMTGGAGFGAGFIGGFRSG